MPSYKQLFYVSAEGTDPFIMDSLPQVREFLSDLHPDLIVEGIPEYNQQPFHVFTLDREGEPRLELTYKVVSVDYVTQDDATH